MNLCSTDRTSHLLLRSAIIICCIAAYSLGDVTLESSNLPIFIINTGGEEIPDDPRIEADMSVIWDQSGGRNHISDTVFNYHGRISIEIRGSYSKTFPKKQYALKTLTDSSTDNEVSLLGLPADEDWILSAPYSDKTLLRNVLIYRLGQELGRYTTRTRFCELILNDTYEGVYVLTERIKRGKGRVDIAKLKETDISGDELTGGYIVKLDKGTGEPGGSGWDLPDPGTKKMYTHYPKPDNITAEQLDYITTYTTEVHTHITGTEAPLSDSLLQQRLDFDSFVDYYIVSEFTKNVDGYRWSIFLHKDKDSNGGKLKMGPIWDFNIAFGNVDYGNAEKTEGFLDEYPGIEINWWRYFILDTLFTAKLKCRWEALRQHTLSWPHIESIIDSLVAEINEAQQRNFQRWDILGTELWPNYFVGETYEEELEYLKSWIQDRIVWLDDNIPGGCNTHIVQRKNDHTGNRQSPSLSDFGLLAFDLERETWVTASLFDIHGRLVKSILKNRPFPSGHNILRWNAMNDNVLLSGKQMYVLILRYDNEVVRTFRLFKLR
jgi:hypothetical protein